MTFKDLDFKHKLINDSADFLEKKILEINKKIDLAEENFDFEELDKLYANLETYIRKINIELKNLEKLEKESKILCQKRDAQKLMK